MKEWLKPIEAAEKTKPTLDLSEWWWNLIDIRDVERAIKNKSWKYCRYTGDGKYFITRNKGERKEYEVSQYEKINLPEKLLPNTIIDILTVFWIDKASEAKDLIEASHKMKADKKPYWFRSKKGYSFWVCFEKWGKPTTKYYPVNKKTYSI